MADDRMDVVIVGAGPAGITAARDLASAGMSVVVLERGAFPGSKNVSGGILYRQPTEEFCPGFEALAPLERPIIEQRYLALTDDAMLGGLYRSGKFAEPPVNAYSVLRSEFDRWYAQTANEAGAEVYPEFTVTDVIWENGQVVGVTTGDSEDELQARCVIFADGANSLLAQRAGLHPEWNPSQQALIAKELISIPSSTIEDRFALPEGMGAAWEVFGASTQGLLGYGFIYTNRESVSIGTGALLSDLVESGYNVSDMLDRFKEHPAIQPLLSGGETIEYSAHLIPESGHRGMPQLYADGVLVVGDAAGLVNPVNREGANLAMLSGRLAAETVIEAMASDDFTARSLAGYATRIEQSILEVDLKQSDAMTAYATNRPGLITGYPEIASAMLSEYLTVDGTSKAEKKRRMKEVLGTLPSRQLVSDVVEGLRLFR